MIFCYLSLYFSYLICFHSIYTIYPLNRYLILKKHHKVVYPNTGSIVALVFIIRWSHCNSFNRWASWSSLKSLMAILPADPPSTEYCHCRSSYHAERSASWSSLTSPTSSRPSEELSD